MKFYFIYYQNPKTYSVINFIMKVNKYLENEICCKTSKIKKKLYHKVSNHLYDEFVTKIMKRRKEKNIRKIPINESI